MANGRRWRLRLKHGESEPLPWSIIKAFVARGKAGAETLVCADGDSEWREMATIPEFQSLVGLAEIREAESPTPDSTDVPNTPLQTAQRDATLDDIARELRSVNKRLERIKDNVHGLAGIGCLLLILVGLIVVFGVRLTVQP